MIDLAVLVLVYGGLAAATLAVVIPALREHGRRFDAERAELEERLGRPLTPAEVWTLYR